jgi:outer membrane protein TolC
VIRLTRGPLAHGWASGAAWPVSVLAICGWILLSPGALGAMQAQPASPDTASRGERITLEQAIERAMRHNPAFRRTTNELELNRLDRQDRWLDILPTPQLTLLNTAMNWTRQTTAVDPFGEPLERDVVDWVQTSRSSQGLGLSMRFDLGEFLQLRQQRARGLGREVAVEAEGNALLAAVSRAFLDLQERLEVLDLEKEILRNSEANRDLALELFRLALRDRLDLVSLELDVVEQEHALEASRAAVEHARLELRNLIGDPDLGEFEIVPIGLAGFDSGSSQLDAARLVDLAVGSSPAIRQAEASLVADEREIDLLRSQWLPTVTLFSNSQRQDFVRGGDAFFNPTPGAGWDASIGLGVSFPDVGQYMRRRNQRQRHEVTVANSRETVREVRAQVEQNLRRLASELRSSALSAELQARRGALATERLELAREAYLLGDHSYLELQGAQEQAARAGRQLLAARFAVERSRIELERSVGSPLEWMPRVDEETR